jgi:hypothetical protein
MIRATLRAVLVSCAVASLFACSGDPPEQPDRGQSSPVPARTSAAAASPGAVTTPAASEPAEHTVIENTVGGAVLRRDESVLRIGQAELLRAKKEDEIFVEATVKGPAETQDCYLMEKSVWFALRDAIENEDFSEAPRMLEVPWADPASTTSFTGGDTLAISFQENTDRKVEGPDTEDTSFFVVCYKVADLESSVTWYDAAHVEGTPEVP